MSSIYNSSLVDPRIIKIKKQFVNEIENANKNLEQLKVITSTSEIIYKVVKRGGRGPVSS